MKVLIILVVLPLCVIHDLGYACNSFYGDYGHGLFGDDYGVGHHHHGHRPLNVHGHGYYNQHHGVGGLMDSLLRTDISGSHGHHHHHHIRTPLIPISHHRHVHRVYRRSPHSRRSRTTST